MNCFLSFFAACRIRSSALGTSFRPCVRDVFCCADSLWPGPFPPSPPPPAVSGLVRRLLRYYGPVRLPAFVHHRLVSLDFPTRPEALFASEATRDLPVPAQGVSVRARGLRPRGTPSRLAISVPRMLPSASPYSVGIPELGHFAAEYPARTFPCQRFDAALADRLRMTRGRVGR